MTSNNTIILRVTNSSTFVDGKFEKGKYVLFKEALGYKDPSAMWKIKNKNKFYGKKWDGSLTTVCYNRKWCKCSIKKDGMHFPSGLISKAIEFMKKENISVKVLDHRGQKPDREINYVCNDKIKPYDYQEKVINDSCNIGRGIIKVATGGGKSCIAAGIIEKLGLSPTIFYVTSIDLLHQAKSELKKFIYLNGSSIEVGQVGGGVKDIKDITVMTVQTAIRSLGYKFNKFDEESENVKDKLTNNDKIEIKDFIQSAKVIIGDETQHWASKTCQIISDNSFSSIYKYGMSATPVRDLGDDILIDSCFGKTICDINASFLIDRNFLVQPTIAFVHIKKSLSFESYQEAYKEGIVFNEERNLIISNLAENLHKEGRTVLILVKFIEHGEILENIINNSFFIHGSHSAKERLNHLNKMRDKKAPITISTSIFDEGINVRPLDGLILAGSGKSQTRALQRVGRTLRKFEDPITGHIKKDSFVIDFYDRMKFMQSHSNKRRNIYKTEPRFIIKDYK